MVRVIGPILVAGFALVGLVIATPVHAQVGLVGPNGLTCVKIKDSLPRGKYTGGGLNGPANLPWGACTVRTPAAFACFSSGVDGLTPQPPGGGPVGSVGGYYCYKVHCPKNAHGDASGKDQFGNHLPTQEAGSPTLFCAPASPSGAFLDGDFS